MKFGDITKTVLIILIFGLLYFASIFTSGMQQIKDDWPTYRCVPTYMPLAGYFGFNTMENFTFCVGNIQKDMMGFFLEPIQYILGTVTEQINYILERVNFIREFINVFKDMIGNITKDVYGMLVNVLIQFQLLITKTKDTMMKLIGILITFVYLIQGANLTGQSINNGPIGDVLREICFSGDTLLSLKNGTTKKMKDIHLGDILSNGTEVYGTLQLKGSSDNPYYKIWSEQLQDYIYVTGDHKIYNSKNKVNNLDNYIEVKDFKLSKKTDYWDETLYCLITDNHQIPIGEYTFWDWED